MANGALTEDEFRQLLRIHGEHAGRHSIEGSLRELRDQSSHHIDDSELYSLETIARRMRGEIFVSQSWMLVEGQADYLIVHAMATAMDFDLDEHDVSVIDVQNNGRADTFAVLARALGISWHAVFDDEKEGRKYINSIRGRGFEESEIKLRCDTHPAGDLEKQVLTDGLGPEPLIGLECGTLEIYAMRKYCSSFPSTRLRMRRSSLA